MLKLGALTAETKPGWKKAFWKLVSALNKLHPSVTLTVKGVTAAV